jgi:hypothetical protein
VSTYVIGQTVTLSTVGGPFKDVDGDPVDPGLVVLTIQEPDGDNLAYTLMSGLTHPGVGQYEFELTLLQRGWYRWEWNGDGIVDSGMLCVGDRIVVGVAS